MKTSTVLKKAKKHLARSYDDTCWWGGPSGREPFICYAISEVITDYDHDDDVVAACTAAKLMIHARLNAYCQCRTLEEWLAHRGIVRQPKWNVKEAEERIYRDKMQVTRHAWIDSMIAEFQAKGD